MLEFIYYLALYLGVGWTMAVLCSRARMDGDLDPDAQRWYMGLVTVLWPAYALAIVGGSLVTVVWWAHVRVRRWLS